MHENIFYLRTSQSGMSSLENFKFPWAIGETEIDSLAYL